MTRRYLPAAITIAYIEARAKMFRDDEAYETNAGRWRSAELARAKAIVLEALAKELDAQAITVHQR